jgi:hypothetical protein
MTELIRWKDAVVDLRAKFVPQRFWLAGSIYVVINGKTILSTGGQLKFKGVEFSRFTYLGSLYQAKLAWGPMIFAAFPCSLSINGEPVAQRRLKADNPVAHLLALAVFLILCAGLGYVLGTSLGYLIYFFTH